MLPGIVIPMADEAPDGGRMKRIKTGFPLLLLVLCWIPAFAQDLASFEKRVTVNKLPNGLTVVLCQAAGGSGFFLCHVG